MAEWRRQTYWQALSAAADRWPEAEAVVVSGAARLGVAAFREEVRRTAANLKRLGLRRGDHIAICMGNRLEWPVLLFAAAALGAVAVPVNTRFKAEELAYCLGQADVRMLAVADRFLGIDFIAMLRAICPEVDSALPSARLPALRRVVAFGEDVPRGATPAAELARAPAMPFDPGEEAVGPDDVALIQYTSGTTSYPKGVMLSHDGMLRDAWHVGRRLGLRPGDGYLSARPLYHVAGTTLSLLTALLAGACYLTTPHFDAEESLRLLDEEHCTHISGNDTMFLMMMNHPSFPARRLHLRGGWAAASETILRQVRERMGVVDLCSAYGLSEASPNVSMGPFDDDAEARLAGFSRPLPGVEVRIRDAETGADCAPGVPGEILVRGWNVMKGYYRMPEQTARAIDAEGWLHTGDLGVTDEDGRLRFAGRLKDVFRVGGENVAPAEVEDVLHRHPAIRQAQVIGVPDPRLVEVPAAYVVLNQGAAATPEQIIAWCRERCANFRVPRHVRIVDGFEDIGMTGSAKVQKNRLRAFALRDLGLG